MDVSSNRIAKLENLSHLKNLVELWASGNQLDSFEDFERELKDNCPDLETVYAEANPLQTNNFTTYRLKMKIMLPQIKQIDAQ